MGTASPSPSRTCWAVVGLILSGTVSVSGWVCHRPGSSQAASKERQFRRWLAEYSGRRQQADAASAVIADLRGRVRTGGRHYTRDEMNER